MQEQIKVDIAIIGGGIAGLWLLNRLRALDYSVVLLESEALGSGQTHKAQGIIHGGIKYALQGSLTGATHAIANMPAIWKQCLAGEGELDLSSVPILSPRQYLWSPNILHGKLSRFFANLILKNKLVDLKKENYPDIFQHPDFKGQVYELDEIVIDTHALIWELAKLHQDRIFKIKPLQAGQFYFTESHQLTEIEIHTEPFEPVRVKAQKYIFTSGAGNELLLKSFPEYKIAMQRRPLHMVMLKIPFLYPLYGHCLGMSTTPRLTITSHRSHDAQTIWYLGGQLAEEGVQRDQTAQIEIAKKELKFLFPWIDFSYAQFASFLVDRAEGLQPDGQRPDSCIINEAENIIAAWPTKLALAPQLAKEIITSVQQSVTKQLFSGDIRALRAWPIPSVAKPMWDVLL